MYISSVTASVQPFLNFTHHIKGGYTEYQTSSNNEIDMASNTIYLNETKPSLFTIERNVPLSNKLEKFFGTWKGTDFDDVLDLVYASRSNF